MKIVEQSYKIESNHINPTIIEAAGRTCYKSDSHGDPESFITSLITRGHESVLEHGLLTVRFITDRGVTHELVRHRLASYSQESTRYCNYGSDKFGSEITVIKPIGMEVGSVVWQLWKESCEVAERKYLDMLALGVKPQLARSVLPNSLKTEIVVSANPREWRHIFKLRCSSKAHPQIRHLMLPLLIDINNSNDNGFNFSCIFNDLYKILYEDLPKSEQDEFRNI